MANWMTPNDEQLQSWKEWVATRPKQIQELAERFPPWSLYRMKPHGQRVSVAGYSEGEPPTLRVNISADHNALIFERQVFGIDPNNLEPCELPAEDEVTGAILG